MSATIMIADDNERILQVLARVLEGLGTEVVTVKDGRSVLAVARQKAPDLIILDVRMPGFDGYQVCAALREYAPTREIPILMLTGLSGESERLLGLQAGADRYMTKPFDISELRQQVESLLGRLPRTPAGPLAGLPGPSEIERELAGRLRVGRPFWFYHAEIRGLSELSRAYGPAFGEEILRRTAAILVGEARGRPESQGFVGHLRGEGFVMLSGERLDAQGIQRGFERLALEFLAPEGAGRGWYAAVDPEERAFGPEDLNLELKEVRCERGLAGRLGKAPWAGRARSVTERLINY